MATETLILEDIRDRSLEELLSDVVNGSVPVIVRMPDGEEVIIEPRPRLKPLPELEGYVPKGWKDAICGHGWSKGC